MKSVEEHISDILDAIEPLPPLDLALLEADGGVLAEPVTAPVALPPFDNSAMDGYAVVAADLADASEESPVVLSVTGDIAAGDQELSAVRTGAGLTVRIMTGAPMPAGADAVVPVEWTDGGTVKVAIRRSVAPGQYIRLRGEDVTEGQVVLDPGVRLGATQLGMLAAVGRSGAAVRPRPRVVVLSTGSELVEPGESITAGQIWDSNSFMLTTAAVEAGCAGYRHGIVTDDPAEVLRTIEDQLARADAIVTSGGVSMGARDVVKEVLTGLGTMRFEKVAMRPGKPQGFGLIDDRTPIFTLPGNPVSAYVSFQVFVRPALRKMQGLPPDRSSPAITAALTRPVKSPAGLKHFLRGVLRRGDGAYTVTPLAGQGSHQLAALAASNVLIVVPPEVTSMTAGDQVEIMELP